MRAIEGKTLAELFPGKLGRLKFARVMLAVRVAELNSHPWDEELSEKMLNVLRAAIREDERS